MEEAREAIDTNNDGERERERTRERERKRRELYGWFGCHNHRRLELSEELRGLLVFGRHGSEALKGL